MLKLGIVCKYVMIVYYVFCIIDCDFLVCSILALNCVVYLRSCIEFMTERM